MKTLFSFLVSLVFVCSATANTFKISYHSTQSVIDTSDFKEKELGAFDEVLGEAKSGEGVEDIMFTSSKSGNTNKISENTTSLEYIRRPKVLADNFSGYKIELFTVYNQPLPLTDNLFKSFGRVTFKNKTKNSTTYYIGEFQDKKAVEEFLQKIILSRFSKAKGVKFKKGKEVSY